MERKRRKRKKKKREENHLTRRDFIKKSTIIAAGTSAPQRPSPTEIRGCRQGSGEQCRHPG